MYGVFFSTAAKHLKNNIDENGLKEFQEAFKSGTQAIMDLGKASLGDRTMIDVLLPVSDTLSGLTEFSKKLIEETISKSLDTVKSLKAKKGRSRYQDGKEIGLPDPGCELAAIWLTSILSNN